jgi:hypothetical protein
MLIGQVVHYPAVHCGSADPGNQPVLVSRVQIMLARPALKARAR